MLYTFKNFRNRPNQKILSECIDEKFTFKIYSDIAEHTISYNEILKIEGPDLSYKFGGQEFSYDINDINEIQTLPKTKVVNIFIRSKSNKQKYIFLVIISIGAIGYYLGEYLEKDWLIAAGITFSASWYITYFYIFISQSRRYKQKVHRAIDSYRINTLIEDLEKSSKENYYTKLINVNLKYMDDYYHLVHIQTSKSYQLTRLGAIVGFLILLVGIVISYFTNISGKSNSLISTGELTIASGIIIEFISAVFFYMYNKTIQQLNIYHDKLIAVQDTTLALKVAESITDDTIKNRTMKYLTEILTNKLIETPESITSTSHESVTQIGDETK